MRRREFIKVIGSGVVAWPLATARAQQSERVRRIGVLQIQAADDAERQAYLAAFRQELERLGWADGRNIQIDYRWGAGNAADTRKYATELVALTPDVIFTIGSASMPPLLQATGSVPIVFALVADPVGAGFVNSLARPGGNATGFISVEYTFGGKWLELLKEIAPSVTHVVVIRDPPGHAGIGVLSAGQSAWSDNAKPRSRLARRRVPRNAIQPDANALDSGSKRLSHRVPRAEGGATINASLHRVPAGASMTRKVGGTATPASRYAALMRSTAPCV